MAYKNILIDLDGTITDSFPGIASSFSYALGAFGIKVENINELRRVVGPPISESFKLFYGFSEEQALEGVEKYREYYHDRGIFENSVYEGVPTMLRQLSENGKKLYLATSKPRPYAERILEHFGLSDYFTYISGSEFDGTRAQKHQVIEYIMQKYDLSADTSLMVGDRLHDIEGAKICKISCLAVLYGYGTIEEFRHYKADFVCATPEEAAKCIIENRFYSPDSFISG